MPSPVSEQKLKTQPNSQLFAAKRQTLHSSLKGEKQQKRFKKDKKNTHHPER